MKDRDENLALQQQMTSEMKDFSTNLLGQYKDIAEQLVNLKEAINQYIYRPVTEARVNAE
jgi:flagellar hook-associated protein FlgK